MSRSMCDHVNQICSICEYRGCLIYLPRASPKPFLAANFLPFYAKTAATNVGEPIADGPDQMMMVAGGQAGIYK